MERVDYLDTFIAVAEDSTAVAGTVPPVKQDKPTVAARTFRMIAEHPYRFTSGDVIFSVFADRNGVPEQKRAAALRSSTRAVRRACARWSSASAMAGASMRMLAGVSRGTYLRRRCSEAPLLQEGRGQNPPVGPVGSWRLKAALLRMKPGLTGLGGFLGPR